MEVAIAAALPMVETEIVTDKDILVEAAMVTEEGLEEVIEATIEMGGVEMEVMGEFHCFIFYVG